MSAPRDIWARLAAFAVDRPAVVALVLGTALAGGLIAAPFDWTPDVLPRSSVAVDALPDLGENQQIVVADWPGHSPRDVEDRVTYPLSTALLGLPRVASVRTSSMLGLASLNVIFEEGADFYWARSRILEKLNSLSPDALPDEVRPRLGPDATAVGQVFWYTLEGRTPDGRRVDGWELHELRALQDFNVRYALTAVEGVSEVASVGGHVREILVEVDPDALRAYGLSLEQVADAVRQGNVDVGARTLEINRVEYVVRGLGAVEDVEDVAGSALAMRDGTAILLRDVARVTLAPATRRGVLDDGGREAVGGVVVARYGADALDVIDRVKQRIAQLAPGLPERTLPDGTVSRVTVVPFYDRTELIGETLGTLERTVGQQMWIAAAIALLLLGSLRAGLLLGSLLPAAVLLAFGGMRLLDVDANLVSLAGIALAVGSVVDAGAVLCDGVLRRLEAGAASARAAVIEAAGEVSGAVVTALSTTVLGFLPVLTLTGAEGRLFRPLAVTKTLVLLASIALTLLWVPLAARWIYGWSRRPVAARRAAVVAAVVAGVVVAVRWNPTAGVALIVAAAGTWPGLGGPGWLPRATALVGTALAVAATLVELARGWRLAGPEAGRGGQLLVVALVVLGFAVVFWLIRRGYPAVLTWTLRRKAVVLLPVVAFVVVAAAAGFGARRVLPLPDGFWAGATGSALQRAFPGLGREFLPSFDEGDFLLMPTLMTHASIGEATETLAAMDRAVARIPEVQQVVGKIGRVDSALDPAPLSMVESLVRIRPEYRVDAHGRRLTFAWNRDTGAFVLDDEGQPIPDPKGRPFRQWRPSIRDSGDLWREIAAAAGQPGLTGAPRLHPIETRQIMLQTGMRSAAGLKVFGADPAQLEPVALAMESVLRDVPGIEPASVFADRGLGKPYLEIELDRQRLADFGIAVATAQRVIATAVGGREVTATTRGRERLGIRVRYPRERRDGLEALGALEVPAPSGGVVRLDDLASIRYRRGPQAIRGEDTFPVTFVTFGVAPGATEVEVVQRADAALDAAVARGALSVPAGVHWEFDGTYRQRERAMARLTGVLPLALAGILLLLILHFRSLRWALLVFSGVALAWAGGLALLWLYGQPWFLPAGWRDMLGVRPIASSVAVWVGFLALFGIAVDDGLVMATRLRRRLAEAPPTDTASLHDAVVEAARGRVRACLVTSATTLLALLPVLTSPGRGADLMMPIAVPVFGGMIAGLGSLLLVPVAVSAAVEGRWLFQGPSGVPVRESNVGENL